VEESRLQKREVLNSPAIRSFIRRIQILIQNLVHCKHMHPILLEDVSHGFVASNLPLVARVLQVIGFDVLPDLLDSLRAGERALA